MSYEALPANTVHRRTGTIGKFMNRVKPLNHEENRRERLLKAIESKDETEAIRLIQNTGMKPSDFDRYPFIYKALEGYMMRVLEALIAAGADVNKGNDEYVGTPLFYAVNRDPPEFINTLISGGADVNEPCGYDRLTPLHLAISKVKVGVVRILVAAGANLNMRTRKGQTPLEYARYWAVVFRHRNENINEIIRILKPTDERLNIPVTDRNFNAEHDTDPISLEDIKEGNEYYMMNENVNPYLKGTMKELLKSNNPLSPTTRKPITTITRHKRPATSGGRKRTRKHRSKKRNTRRKA